MFKFSAGKYCIIDLCYVLKNHWDEFCSKTIQGDVVLDGEFNISGARVVSFVTAYGDGVYQDMWGHEYSVDAGLIGMISVEDLEMLGYTNWKEDIDGLGHVVQINSDFRCFNDGGVMYFGPVKIDTVGDDDSDDDEDFYEEDEQY